MRSSYVKDRTISYQNNDEWCEEECDSYNWLITIIDPANEELKNPYNDDNGNHRPCKQQIVKWSNVPYNLMDGLVCNIVRDFLRVMLHFATESKGRDTTH